MARTWTVTIAGYHRGFNDSDPHDPRDLVVNVVHRLKTLGHTITVHEVEVEDEPDAERQPEET